MYTHLYVFKARIKQTLSGFLINDVILHQDKLLISLQNIITTFPRVTTLWYLSEYYTRKNTLFTNLMELRPGLK